MLKQTLSKVIFALVIVGMIMAMLNIQPANAVVETFTIELKHEYSTCIALNATNGIHGSFLVQNGRADFAFLDPNGVTLFGSYQTNGTIINYTAPKDGNYTIRFSNPSPEGVLIELTYSVKSWHLIAQWEFTLSAEGIPWVLIFTVIAIVYIALRLLIDFLGKLRDIKTIIVKPLVTYGGPDFPIAIRELKCLHTFIMLPRALVHTLKFPFPRKLISTYLQVLESL